MSTNHYSKIEVVLFLSTVKVLFCFWYARVCGFIAVVLGINSLKPFFGRISYFTVARSQPLADKIIQFELCDSSFNL